MAVSFYCVRTYSIVRFLNGRAGKDRDIAAKKLLLDYATPPYFIITFHIRKNAGCYKTPFGYKILFDRLKDGEKCI